MLNRSDWIDDGGSVEESFEELLRSAPILLIFI